MITGYNTDIEFDGIVYHVQTEDKGVTSPVIMSLVYNRGTILASKRVPYDDLLAGTLDERVLAERLQRQHKLICAAVSAGRIEDLKEMSARNLKAAAAKRAKRSGEDEDVQPSIEAVPHVEIPVLIEGSLQLEVPAHHEAPAEISLQTEAGLGGSVSEVLAEPGVESQLPKVLEPVIGQPDAEVAASPVETAPTVTEPIEDQPTEIPAAEVPKSGFVSLSPEVPEPKPAVELEAETKVYSNLLTQVEIQSGEADEVAPIAKPIFDPLPVPPAPPVSEPTPTVFHHNGTEFPSSEPMILVDAVEAVSDLAGRERPDTHQLSVDIIGDTKFKGGERKDVYVMVCRGTGRKVVPRAEVMVKVLGSTFRPVICHAVTDGNGLATINLKIPQFQTGRATVIARAISEGEEVEIRQAVAHG